MDRASTIELAVRNERIEIEFYRGEADRATNRAARALFEMLADQERQHIALLEDLGARLARQGAWPEQIPRGALATSIEDVLDELRRSFAGRAGPDRDLDQLAALRKAVEFERRAEQFYDRLADRAEAGAEELFFRTLAGFERDHRGWIEAFYATLEEDRAR